MRHPMQPAGTLGGPAVPLSLLSLSWSTRLALRPRTLRKPARARAIESARLCRGTSARLRASRATCTHTTDVLSAGALGVGLERRLRRRGSSPRAEPLLVLRI
jgi:hypothetical protein